MQKDLHRIPKKTLKGKDPERLLRKADDGKIVSQRRRDAVYLCATHEYTESSDSSMGALEHERFTC